MDFLSIQGVMGKLQPTRKESIRLKKIWVHKYFFQSKMIMNILKEEEEDLEEEAEITSIDQTVDWMKGAGRPVQVAIAIWDLDLTVGLTN